MKMYRVFLLIVAVGSLLSPRVYTGKGEKMPECSFLESEEMPECSESFLEKKKKTLHLLWRFESFIAGQSIDSPEWSAYIFSDVLLLGLGEKLRKSVSEAEIKPLIDDLFLSIFRVYQVLISIIFPRYCCPKDSSFEAKIEAATNRLERFEIIEELYRDGYIIKYCGFRTKPIFRGVALSPEDIYDLNLQLPSGKTVDFGTMKLELQHENHSWKELAEAPGRLLANSYFMVSGNFK